MVRQGVAWHGGARAEAVVAASVLLNQPVDEVLFSAWMILKQKERQVPKSRTPMICVGISMPIGLREELLGVARLKYRSLSALCREYLTKGLHQSKKPKLEVK